MYVLGIDIGTTGTKAMLMSSDGKIVSSAYKGYPLIKGSNGFVEQDAEDWWKAFVQTVRECLKDVPDKQNVIALSMSTQGGSLVPVDKAGKPLANALSWMDFRSREQQEVLIEEKGKDFYYRKTGWRLNTGLNLTKIKWLRENEQALFQSTDKLLTTIDYVNYKLTGSFVIDPTNGAMTQLMNVGEEQWDSEILNMLNINKGHLPNIQKSCTEIGTLTDGAAHELGLPTSVKVINGGHDQYCAAIGAGAFNSGDIILSTGTAWVVLGVYDKPLFDSSTYIAPAHHITEGLWGALASIPTAGVAMEWFRDNLSMKIKDGTNFECESFREIDEKAASLRERAEGLFFYPYFSGNGFPRWNQDVKGSLLGLGLEHGRYDIALAIMEGVAFQVKAILEEYEKSGFKTSSIRILGGASKSPLWTEIISSVVGCSAVKFNEANIACIGAALIAGVGCGMFSDFTEGFKKAAAGVANIERNSEMESFYQRKYSKYKKGIEFLEKYYKG